MAHRQLPPSRRALKQAPCVSSKWGRSERPAPRGTHSTLAQPLGRSPLATDPPAAPDAGLLGAGLPPSSPATQLRRTSLLRLANPALSPFPFPFPFLGSLARCWPRLMVADHEIRPAGPVGLAGPLVDNAGATVVDRKVSFFFSCAGGLMPPNPVGFGD